MPDAYAKVTPFFYANKLKALLFIVHGVDDANAGITSQHSSKLSEPSISLLLRESTYEGVGFTVAE